jgi:hypothetical protein
MNIENRAEEYNPFSHLEKLKNDSYDEVPEYTKNGPSQKFSETRKDWWQCVISNLGIIAEDKMVPEELLEEIKVFIDRFAGQSRDLSKRMTNIGDVAEANAIINKVLSFEENLEQEAT